MDKYVYPLLPLRGLVVYPGNVVTFDVGRDKSIKSIEEALNENSDIVLFTQKDHEIEEPKDADLFRIGTLCKIKQIMRFAEERLRVLVEGVSRVELINITNTEPHFEAEVLIINDQEDYSDSVSSALSRNLIDSFYKYAEINPKVVCDKDAILIKHGNDISGLTFDIANSLNLLYTVKQQILQENDAVVRAEKLISIILKETEILMLEKEIAIKVQVNISKMQRDTFLREQMKVIRQELGETVDTSEEIDEYRAKAEEMKLPEEVYKKVQKEIDRLSKLPQGYPEASVISNYIDLILSLPWNTKTEEHIDLDEAEDILNEDHYGLEKVKERVIEYLAVRKLNNTLRGPILCLVGPPGVGKTSIAKSVARALNRKYVRMSLGGVKDESEIRGHRKTYVGAMPGRIINAVKQAGTNNPLILLDEIDKMSSDFRGDPASAMLEVLDGEQNFSFRDHYIEVPFDLSDVMFVCTANSTDTIPGPLLDRMEIIEVASYTEEEKLQIAVRYLFPKQLKAHGLSEDKVTIDEKAMRDLINCYTAEAGVRGLEREIARMCRKIARQIAARKRKSFNVSESGLEKLMGAKKRLPEKIRTADEVGVATGLAWTSIGGVTLNIEVNIMQGSGKIELTGHLGDVMKESALAALSYIRSRIHVLNLDKDFYSKYDIHIHIPEGATPKDGPSAGITLATAMVSALTGIPVKKSVAMTGEITLRGRVLPIGGLKEKALAAHRAGIKTVIIPEDNRKDLEEIPANVRKEMKFIAVSEMEQVLEIALCDYKTVKDSVISKVSDDRREFIVTDIM